MLEDVSAVLQFEAAPDADAVVLKGALPAGMSVQDLRAMCADKPNMRKLAERLAIVLPVATTLPRWQAWVFDTVPPLNALSALVQDIQARGAAVLAASGAAQPGQQGAEASVTMADGQVAPDTAAVVALTALGQGSKRGVKAVLQVIANAMIETGLCQFAALAELRRGKVRALTLSDQVGEPYADELRHVILHQIGDEPQQRRIPANDFTAENLDPALLGDMFGGGDLVLDLPAPGTHGYAFMLFGATAQAETQLAALKAVLAAALPGRTPRPMRALALRGAALTTTAALLVWLALPAPLKVTATATSLPASAQAMALPFEAFLEQMHVRVGDQVAAGDPIADLRAPNLLDQRADLVAQIAIEEVSAQSALSANDYGAYVLSEQKIAQNRKRLDQLEERLAQLQMRAPFDARVVQALGHEVLGAYQPTGENIAVVQPENRYAARLKIARVDAPLLQVGQSGEIWFRGISGQEWQLNVTSAPSLTVDPTTGEEELTLKAELLGQDQARLFAGLTGFARIEAGEQMRALVLSRYAREYIRMKLWTWFDFQL